MSALRQPVAHVVVDGIGQICVAVPCNLDRLHVAEQREAVRAADRADNAMTAAAGGHLLCFPAKRDVSCDPPGYVYRINYVSPAGAKGYDGWKQRIAKAALAAALTLEDLGYEVHETTPELRIAALAAMGERT